METTGDIRRREHNTERALLQGFAVRLIDRLEEALLQPPLIMCGFDLYRIIARGQIAGYI